MMRQLWGVYTIQQTSSKSRVFCWKFAGRLLDRINTLFHAARS